MEDNEYILEFIPHGKFMKISAVDPVTGTEAVIVGDADFPRELLAREAIKKLEYILKKQ